MVAVKRFKQIAEVIGMLVILAAVAAVGAVVYLWWGNRRLPRQHEVDTRTDSTESAESEKDEPDIESESVEEEPETA